MTKPFASCALPDLVYELFLDARAAAAQLLLRLADAETTEAALQRHPLVRGASGLFCAGSAESEQAWCGMLRDLFSASGAAVSDADLRRVYLVCRQCCRRGHVRVCAFISRVLSHPAAAAAGHELLAQLTAHPVRCLASQLNVQRWPAMLHFRTPSPAHEPHWHATGIHVGQTQRRVVLCGGSLLSVLVPRLLCVQGESGVRQPFHLAQRIASRRHFLGSYKDEAEVIFEEGQRLYREQLYSEAVKCWGQAALLQHAPSHAFASSLLYDGRADVPKDEQRAFEFASCGVALGCAHSKGALGRCLLYGTGDAKDVERGLALAMESADEGSGFGQFVLGTCYDTGNGVTQDHAEAVRWHRLSAAQGHAVAQCNLGGMFSNGDGVAQDDVEAVRWLRLAAAQGDALAQFAMGVTLQNGRGVTQDYAEAVRWYRLAATQRFADAQYNLGFMFRDGHGVTQDNAESVRWIQLAAVQGHVQAQMCLGIMYEKDQFVDQDYAEALRWYRLAAAQGHPCATRALTRLGAKNCMDGDYPQSAVQMDKDFQDLCNIKFAASCSMNLSPNDVGRVAVFLS
jgi:TPR repeat protein